MMKKYSREEIEKKVTLSTKYEYTDNILEYWKKRLCANHYEISVKRSQLIVAFYVMF